MVYKHNAYDKHFIWQFTDLYFVLEVTVRRLT
jgi:hypothetical protein